MGHIKHLALAAGLLAMVAAYAATSGPEAGGGAPMLQIDAVNDDAGAYCFTCKAGQQPAVLTFITRDDERSRALIMAVCEAAKANEEKHLNTAIVFLGGSDAFDKLVAWAKESEIKLPLARIEPGARPLEPWKLNREVSTTTVFIRQHSVHASVADLDPEKVAEQVAPIVA